MTPTANEYDDLRDEVNRMPSSVYLFLKRIPTARRLSRREVERLLWEA